MSSAPKPQIGDKQEMKLKMRQTWSDAAARYNEWVIGRSLAQNMLETFKEDLVPRLASKASPRILDIASASGEPAATLAAALPHAHVLATDLVDPYLELGRARAARLGLTNVEFDTADAEDLSRYADASFDAVTCSLGVMFFPDPPAALAEFARVLKPGGVLAVSVWGPEERVPFFRATLQLAREYDPDVPGSITAARFGDPAELLSAIEAAGMHNVRCQDKQTDFFLPKDIWWPALTNMPLPVKAAVSKAQEARPSDDVFAEAHSRAQTLFSEHGCLDNDGNMRACDNHYWFITADKSNRSGT